MFKKLHNEAIYRFRLKTASPFVIKSGEEDILDPNASKGQLLRSLHNWQRKVVIPGSTLKGVFRSRAEQLMRTMGCSIEGKFIRGDNESGQFIYEEKSDAAQQLFGSTALKGRIVFNDAFPAQGTEVVEGLRHMVGINRITGGADNGRKFDTEVVEQGTFEVEVRLVNYELKHLALIAWLLLDLHEGFMKIGSFTTRGFGRFEVEHLTLQVHEYRRKVDKLTGFFENDSTGETLHWNNALLKKTATFEGLEQLIGPSGLFQSVPMEFK